MSPRNTCATSLRRLGGLSAALAVCLLPLGAVPGDAAASPYPSVPATLGAPASVLTTEAFDWVDLWVGQPGAMQELSPQPDGSLALARSVSLPAGAQPLAVASYGVQFVLDAATGSVLAYRQGSIVDPIRLPVGSDPVALAVTDVDSSRHAVVVANAGSDDLSVYAWSGDFGDLPVFAPEQRIALGHSPDALAPSDSLGEPVVAVGYSDFSSVSLLRAAVQFARSDLNVDEPTSRLLWAGFGFGDSQLVLGSARSPRVRVLAIKPSGAFSMSVLTLADPGGTAADLAIDDFNDDRRRDIAVADAGDGNVVVFDGTPDGTFAAARTIASGLRPSALVSGQFGGDAQRDLAVLDGQGTIVRLLLTPGDPQLVAASGAINLVTGGDRVAWAQGDSRQGYHLITRRGAVSTTVPTPTSSPASSASCGPLAANQLYDCGALLPRFGRLSGGRAAISFVACRDGRCRPYAWDLDAGVLRRLAIPAPRGCEVSDVTIWYPRIAYELIGTRQSRCPKSGVVVRTGTHTVMHVKRAWLGDFRPGRLAWFASWPKYNGEQLRVARVGHRSRRLDGISADYHGSLEDARLSGRYVVWGRSDDDDMTTLWRQRLDRPRSCPQVTEPVGNRNLLPLGNGGYHDSVFAVRGDSILYPYFTGIFRVDPARLHWRKQCPL